MNTRVVGTISQTNPNPSSSFVTPPNTTADINAGDKVIALLDLRNNNPTGVSFSVDGHAFTEDTAARSTRTDSLVVMYWDATVTVPAGAAVAGSWTNTGTQDGGGAQAQIVAITPDTGTTFTAGGSVARGNANGLSTNPRIPAGTATVTPPSSTAKYLALTSFIITSAGTAGEAVAPPTGFTGFPVVNNASRAISIWTAYEELAAPAAALAAAWTAPSHNWAGTLILIEQPSASAPSNTAAPVVTGTPAVGSTLSTTDGSWTGTPTSFGYQWQRDVGTGAVSWLDIPGATSSTYVVPGSPSVAYDDVGSKLRCRVTATNAAGSSAPAASNATASAVPAPAGQLGWRVVSGPSAGSDHQWRQFQLSKPVLDGDLLVLCVACSNADLVDGNGNKQDVGYILDGHGNTWVQKVEAESATDATRNSPQTLDANIAHSAQVFSTHAAGGMAYQDAITMTVHKAGGPPTGDGDALAYHGQSPYWYIVAVSTGDSRVLDFDAGAHNVGVTTPFASPSAAAVNNDAIAFSFHASGCAPGAAAGWWTPTGGFTELADAPTANGNGGETDYQIAGAVKVSSTGFSGTASGTTGANRNTTNLLAVFSAPSAAGDQTLSVGKAAAAPAARGVSLAPSGAATLSAGRTSAAPAARGVTLTAAGSVTLSAGRVTAPATVAGINLTAAGATLSIGRTAAPGTAKGATLTAAGTATLSVGRASSSPVARGVNVTGTGVSTLLALGRVTRSGIANGINVGPLAAAGRRAGTLVLRPRATSTLTRR
jgi:hypothetical protein